LEARADLETAQGNLELVQIGIGSDVANTWSSMKYAEQRVVVASTEERNAQENLRIAQGRFQAGLGTFLEVTDAEASLVAAREAAVS
ncbi:TolC family protein, partial [Vibrio parahaemolyticus]